jgi:hypothetical protein
LALCWLALAAAAVQAQPESKPPTEERGTAAEQASDTDADKNPAAESGDSSTRDDDFKPTEEISEDFPVSLPADI